MGVKSDDRESKSMGRKKDIRSSNSQTEVI